jgi:hypothetical protein
MDNDSNQDSNNTIGSQKPESYDIDIEANNIEVTDTITVVWCIES